MIIKFLFFYFFDLANFIINFRIIIIIIIFNLFIWVGIPLDNDSIAKVFLIKEFNFFRCENLLLTLEYIYIVILLNIVFHLD